MGAGAALPEGVERTELDGGVRVITDAMPSVRSVALGLWVRTGSRDEHPGQAGVSHFLEHLLFKGTERYSAIEISELFDGLGASTNAATSKESTHLYARLLDEHTDEAFDLLAEMLLGPTYPEVDSERQVVLEEIAMYEDEPQDRVHDVLADAVFGDHPLGRRVIGEAEVIASIPIPKIAEYHAERYVGPNVVVSAAGHVDHAQIVELARKHVSPPRGGASSNGAGKSDEPQREPRMCFYEKKTEQYHVCLGAPGIPRGDDRRFALGVANAVLGGSTSSRLFREVREKRGLAYAVGSYSDEYIDNGLVATYVGTREDNVAEALDVIGSELASVASEGISDEELRARQGAHQGPHGARARVELGPHVADRPLDDVRRAAALARRDARPRQRRHERGRGDDRRRALRPEPFLRRLRRHRRGPLPQGPRAGQPGAHRLAGMAGEVVAVSRRAEHSPGKTNQASIRLVPGIGVEGDAHAGEKVQHRSRVRRDPDQPNLRQVHLISAELHDELRGRGFEVGAGEMGENVTTRGLDLLALPTGARLRLGDAAVDRDHRPAQPLRAARHDPGRPHGGHPGSGRRREPDPALGSDERRARRRRDRGRAIRSRSSCRPSRTGRSSRSRNRLHP